MIEKMPKTVEEAKKFIKVNWGRLCDERKLGGALVWYFTMMVEARKVAMNARSI